MSQEERFGHRDKAYSAWHRRASIGRFVGNEQAALMAMIDADVITYIEYDDGSREPLAIFETAIDVGQSFKNGTVTKNIARRITPAIEAYTVLYKLADQPNPADNSACDIASFRARMIWPRETGWKQFSPSEWAIRLCEIRNRGVRRIAAAAEKEGRR